MFVATRVQRREGLLAQTANLRSLERDSPAFQMTLLTHPQLRLRALRRACGLSQTDLAAHLAVTQATISHWERSGRIRQGNLTKLEQLAALTDRRRRKMLPQLRIVAAELADLCLDIEVSDHFRGLAQQVLDILKQETPT